jgi:hypothetical protein
MSPFTDGDPVKQLTRIGETPEQSRALDLYDLRFLCWTGLAPEQALARLGLSVRSLQRWLAEPARYLPDGRHPVPDYIPQEYIHLTPVRSVGRVAP